MIILMMLIIMMLIIMMLIIMMLIIMMAIQTLSRNKRELLRGICIIILSLIGPSLSALSERLFVHVWCEVSPPQWTVDKVPVDETQAVKQLLEEARMTLSGMLYGYTFLYTPSDTARQVPEVFELKPVQEIPWGDPNLSISNYEQKENRLSAKITYFLNDAQWARLQAWQSNTVPVAFGRGLWSIFKGDDAKYVSFKEAIKEAIRQYLRPREFNKPREIAGEVLVWDEPRTIVVYGDYATTVKIKLFIKTVEPYRMF
jgi:hypothetical protein